nr:M56 family metallopeptidase [Allomuricauda sp.]
MIIYLIEIAAFHFVFLLLYDFFLAKDTFHQWKRIYLLGAFTLSLILPWVSLDFFQLKVLEKLPIQDFSPFFLENITVFAYAQERGFSTLLIWKYIILLVGSSITAIFFAFKWISLYKLKGNAISTKREGYTEFIISDSRIAFSFLKMIFLGDKIKGQQKENIVRHELVHIKHRHSIDLLFFEIMRIPFWFNPMVYVYQRRMSELHEFIADEEVLKNTKRDQYQHLLDEVFQTQNISFINQFFKKSLIKKRIVMLQRKKTKPILKSKYLMVLPMVAVMLFYVSCKESSDNSELTESSLTAIEKEKKEVPFMVVDEVPVFPGCQDVQDKRECFMKGMQAHVEKYFKYPKEAQEQKIEGRVNVLFFITENGDVAGVRTRGPHPLLEDEVKRIIAQLPQMKAGTHKGNPTSVPFSMPITFELD